MIRRHPGRVGTMPGPEISANVKDVPYNPRVKDLKDRQQPRAQCDLRSKKKFVVCSKKCVWRRCLEIFVAHDIFFSQFFLSHFV